MLVRRKLKPRYQQLPESIEAKAINNMMFTVTLMPACGLDVGSIIRHPPLTLTNSDDDEFFIYLGVFLNPENVGCNHGNLAFIRVTYHTYVYYDTHEPVTLSEPIHGVCTIKNYSFKSSDRLDLSQYVVAWRHLTPLEEE